jgi:CRP-like cAMP-binding protein
MEALRGRAGCREWVRGEALFHAGDRGHDVFIIEHGRVKISHLQAAGREVVLTLRGPGELIGEESALDGQPRLASSFALEEVRALVLSRSAFLSFLTQWPAAQRVVLLGITARLREAERDRSQLASLPALGRVSARLVDLANRFGAPGDAGIRIELPLTQDDLAGWTGASRESVARSLQLLRGMGAVKTARRTLIVVDDEALKRCAQVAA